MNPEEFKESAKWLGIGFTVDKIVSERNSGLAGIFVEKTKGADCSVKMPRCPHLLLSRLFQKTW